MIIIPEAEAVVILTPRAGSTALKRMLLNRDYPQAFSPYRHMEADGVPAGYEHYQKFGVVRKPLARLWSVYCFLQRAVENPKPKWHKFDMSGHKETLQYGFRHWVHKNTVPFATSVGFGGYIDPRYHTLHPKPEAQKSQYEYLRPDLGTVVYRFEELGNLVRQIAMRAGRDPVYDPPLVLSERVNQASTRLPADVASLFYDVRDLDAGRPADQVQPLAETLWKRFKVDADLAGGWV